MAAAPGNGQLVGEEVLSRSMNVRSSGPRLCLLRTMARATTCGDRAISSSAHKKDVEVNFLYWE